MSADLGVALRNAANSGGLSAVRVLVAAGANVDAEGDDGETALMLSAAAGHLEIVRFLVERGATLDAKHSNGCTPLIVSARNGELAVVEFLVNHGAKLNERDENGFTALICSASGGSLAVSKFLIERGADVTATDKDGDTPLTCLLIPRWDKQHLQEDDLLSLVRLMLANGASPTQRNGKRESAISIASERGFMLIKLALLSHVRETRASEFPQLEALLVRRSASVEDSLAASNGSSNSLGSNSAHHSGNGLSLGVLGVHGPNEAINGVVQRVFGCTGRTSGTVGDGDVVQRESRVDIRRRLAPHERHLLKPLILPESLSTFPEQDSVARSFRSTCETISARCSLMNEAEPLCRQILSRLQVFVRSTSTIKSPGKDTLDPVVAIAKQFDSLLTLHESKSLVFRLICTRPLVDALKKIYTRIDRLDRETDKTSETEQQKKWEEGVTAMKQAVVLHSKENLTKLANDLSTEKLQFEALTLLVHELKHNKAYYSRAELDLLQLVLARIMGFSKLPVPEVEEWFIPRQEVLIDESELLGRGSFGAVYRASWRKTDVVVKCISVSSEGEKRAFFREVRVWRQIRHPNVVRFIGACHLGLPYFMVSEFAPNGSLTSYLYKQSEAGRSLVWRKLYEVALGLFYLHAEGIVHGDLKGDNILVGKDGTAMLTDFGFSFVQSGSVATVEKWGAIRWRAPEYVIQGSPGPSFASDVYSLAMTIVEAVTGEVPWGLLPDVAVTLCLRRKEMLKRPQCEAITDAVWEMVSQMSMFEPSDRISLDEVVETLKQLALEEEDLEWQSRQASN